MEYLSPRILSDLEETGDGDLFQHINWDVQEDPELEEVEEPEVRRYGPFLLALLPPINTVLELTSSPGASRSTWKRTTTHNTTRGQWHVSQCATSF